MTKGITRYISRGMRAYGKDGAGLINQGGHGAKGRSETGIDRATLRRSAIVRETLTPPLMNRPRPLFSRPLLQRQLAEIGHVQDCLWQVLR